MKTFLVYGLLFIIALKTALISSSADNKLEPENHETIIPSPLQPSPTIANLKENDDSENYITDIDDNYKSFNNNKHSLTNLYKRKNFYSKKNQQNKFLKILARRMIWDNAIEFSDTEQTVSKIENFHDKFKDSNENIDVLNNDRETVNRSGGRRRLKREPDRSENGESLCSRLCKCTPVNNKLLEVYCEFNKDEVS